MNAIEYLDAAKARLDIKSDYALAKALEITKQDVNQVRKGKKPLTPYLCTRIAITLCLDPASVIADVQSQTEKNVKRRAFWQSFLSRAVVLLVLVMCTLASISSITSAKEALIAAGTRAYDYISNLLCRMRLRIMCIM